MKSASISAQWKFVPDEPKSKDFHRLGHFLGDLLIENNYKWVTHYDKLQDILRDIFLPVRTSTFEEHVEDIRFIVNTQKTMKTKYKDLGLGLNNLDLKF